MLKVSFTRSYNTNDEEVAIARFLHDVIHELTCEDIEKVQDVENCTGQTLVRPT